ncbi:hypothetical protein RIE95_09110 [Acidithiobacillus thiooxidans]|uniref:hypothetical protein n=1 Tax=Acidithiobacillus thiooxidans TaxID=930 RepID=UPI00285C861B|nr:hypothetical protein [Acidithiobacillus thiooxidans]MDD2748692.1 hypothetical protein [Acidithiobacillus sp.]MDR7927135.1 hypothetical protein [Acidithiobacillus thiooxidans]
MSQWGPMDARDQARMEYIVAALVELNEGVSEHSVRRLLWDFLRRTQLRDHYLQTEVGQVALGIGVFKVDAHYSFMERPKHIKNVPGQPVPRTDDYRIRFHRLFYNGDLKQIRWLVGVWEQDAPEILLCWQRFVEASFDKTQAASLEKRLRSGRLTPGREADERLLVERINKAYVRARGDWLRMHRPYVPVSVAVDNTKEGVG